uniref:7TM_GPCR_Srx domain-containing protein n=1 Tax=Globodera pallida TaxID=36090 RepID=A0A183BVW7_GLOPA
MELFLFRHAEYERLYNCTGLEINSIALERRQFVPESIVVCVLCAIYYVLYVPCMYSIWKHLRDNSCYKILFYIGIIDLAAMWMPGFFCAWANLRGAVFCSYPTLIAHNTVVAFLSPLIYLIFAAKLFYDDRTNRRQFGVVVSEMGAVQIRIFTQVFLISLMNTLTCFLFFYLQNYEPPQWMVTLADFAWLHVHGLPPLIYLTFNKTIRDDCRLMFMKLFLRHRIRHIGGVTVVRPKITLVNGGASSNCTRTGNNQTI